VGRIVRRSASLIFWNRNAGISARLSAQREWELIMIEYYKSDDEIRSLVDRFEACSFQPSEFRHQQHLAVVLWYVANLSYPDASERMKSGIQRLAASFGQTGYHETITEFWLRMVHAFLPEGERAESIAVLANQFIEKCANKDLILDHYSPELLASPEAKANWLEPDLKPLPFADRSVCSQLDY
jgi:hypothetical protein